jgi:uncharacterized protein YegP (UPF0339 family)
MQNGQYIWRLHSPHNELVARAGTGFETLVGAQRAASTFKAVSSNVRFVVYMNAVGEWRWRACRHRLNIAHSGSTFPTRASAEQAVAFVQSRAGSATGA